MALALRLDGRRPVEAIIRYCRARIVAWVNKAGGARSIAQVQNIICQNLDLVLEEVWSDKDVEDVSQKYLALGEKVFASLSMQLGQDTFATVMRREHAAPKARDRYVAVIDCRGKKAARRFFTRWHEIAHILTLVTQLELPFQRFRSRAHADPVERLMDVIAGEVGFYEPVFEPALAAELQQNGLLSFDGVERVRSTVCSEASFQATLIACVKRASTPIIQLEAAMRYKKCEEVELASGQLSMFSSPKPSAKLRAYPAVPNAAAKKCAFLIHPNMQIPEPSLISDHYKHTLDIETSVGVSGIESFSLWKCSDGTTCGNGQIHVQVRKLAGTLLAVVQPA
jgi:hypothetical protein